MIQSSREIVARRTFSLTLDNEIASIFTNSVRDTVNNFFRQFSVATSSEYTSVRASSGSSPAFFCEVTLAIGLALITFIDTILFLLFSVYPALVLFSSRRLFRSKFKFFKQCVTSFDESFQTCRVHYPCTFDSF